MDYKAAWDSLKSYIEGEISIAESDGDYDYHDGMSPDDMLRDVLDHMRRLESECS